MCVRVCVCARTFVFRFDNGWIELLLDFVVVAAVVVVLIFQSTADHTCNSDVNATASTEQTKDVAYRQIFGHFLPGYFVTIGVVERVPVNLEVRLILGPHQYAIFEVVETHRLVRALPSQVQAPTDLVGQIVEAEG